MMFLMGTSHRYHTQNSASAGFTLLEMSIVLVIMGFIIVGAMVVFTQSLSASQLSDTNAKLATIQKALYDFRVANGRLPCPADATLLVTDKYFGVEGANPGDCIGGSTAPTVSTYDSSTGVRSAQGTTVPTANIARITGGSGAPGGSQDMREGMLPTRTLRLSDDYSYDAWGRRFMYAVTRDMTQNDAFNLYPGSDSTTRMTINNALGSASTTQAIYAVISFGPNGHGAYLRAGGSTRFNNASLNADEQTNCHCNSSATPQAISATFVQKYPVLDSSDANGKKNFDDIVAYGTRSSLMLQASLYWNVVNAAANAMICPPASKDCETVGSIRSCYCNQ